MCATHAHLIGGNRKHSLLTIDECRSKININSVFYCHVKNGNQKLFITIFLSTFVDSINDFDCCLSGVIKDSNVAVRSNLLMNAYQRDCSIDYKMIIYIHAY